MQTDSNLRRPLGNVLVGTDFSGGSELAIERAASLPITAGSAVVLLHVIATDANGLAEKALKTTELEGMAQRAAAAAALAGRPGLTVFQAVGHGTPFVEIIRRARTEHAELICIGRHGGRTFAGALMGSTAERVLRKGDTAVLIVNTKPAGPYRRPLVAIDLSDTSRSALLLALRMVDTGLKTCDVVHVAGPRPSQHEEPDPEKALETLLAGLEDAGVKWNIVLRKGDAREAILDEANRRRSDLLVVGTHGRSGLAHLLLGSVAEGVIRSATCDVLAARAAGHVFAMP